jgi:hypothetical protein
MKSYKILIIVLAGLIILTGCRGSNKETKIAGMVNYNGTGVPKAAVEIYLKADKDKATPPFMIAETDDAGSFEIILPAGRYFIIGKKRFIEGGITRMLMGEYPKNPVDVKVGETLTIPPFSLFSMGEDKRLDIEGAGVIGKVTADVGDVAGSFVYIYPESNPDMIGPSYVISQEIGSDGRFKVNLLPGRYYIAVRQRGSRAKLGYLNLGDLSVECDGNPVTVISGKYVNLGGLKLHTVDEKKLAQIREDEAKLTYEARITGKIVNEDSEPVEGVYVYAYKDPKMVGKPESISKKTDEDGRYTLYLTGKEGSSDSRYYIGARANFGGPLEPGEYVGTYNANPEHLLIVGKKKDIMDIDITVKEVW